MRFVLYIFFAFFLIGCDNASERFDPYKVTRSQTQQQEHQVALKKLENDTKIELAKIEAQKEKSLKEIEAKNHLEVANIQKEVSLKEQDVLLKAQDETSRLYQNIALLFASICIVAIIVYAYLSKKRRDVDLQMKQEELQKERDLHKEACYNDRMNKMLEIVASTNTDQKVKDKLVEILGHDVLNDPLLKHKK